MSRDYVSGLKFIKQNQDMLSTLENHRERNRAAEVAQRVGIFKNLMVLFIIGFMGFLLIFGMFRFIYWIGRPGKTVKTTNEEGKETKVYKYHKPVWVRKLELKEMWVKQDEKSLQNSKDK